MEKLLTISIAAYNVEKYIRQTLDSCILPDKYMQSMEVLVVDDGATDNTAQIVKEYEQRFPETIRLINKENGGYGTTVNTSVRLAKGKFFKLLDGDDWFNKQGLLHLLDVLTETEADIVFNRMYKEYPDKEILATDTWETYIGREMNLAEVEAGIYAGMWEMTVNTKKLQANWVDLPGRTLYTDHFYIMQSLPEAQTVCFLDFPVYCYRLGYDEQSVSWVSRKKHIDEIVRVSKLVSQYYVNFCKNTPNAVFARERARFTYMEAHRAIQLKDFSLQTMLELKQFDDELRSVAPDVFAECEKRSGRKSLIFLRKTKYVGLGIIYLKDCWRRKKK